MINRVVLVGRLVRDPDIRSSESGKVASFSVAINRRFKNNEGNIDADFIRCVAFGKLADLIEMYVFKGHLVGIEGRLRSGSYQNSEGRTVYFTDVQCESLDFLTPKKESSSGNSANYRSDSYSSLGQEMDNPFNTEDKFEDEDFSSFKIASDDLPF